MIAFMSIYFKDKFEAKKKADELNVNGGDYVVISDGKVFLVTSRTALEKIFKKAERLEEVAKKRVKREKAKVERELRPVRTRAVKGEVGVSDTDVTAAGPSRNRL